MNNKVDVTERLTFLAKEFDVFEIGSEDVINTKIIDLNKDGYVDVKPLKGDENLLLGLLSTKKNEKGKIFKKVSISFDIFTRMIGSDPTKNKSCVQWMLTLFCRYIKNGEFEEALRFANEDLPQANEYLTVFEANKRKKNFKIFSEGSYVLKGINNVSDINQYKSLAQLFDAVDPFIKKDSSELERIMEKFVTLGLAEIPVKDRKFTVFVPKNREANVIFDKFAGWCTAKSENGEFKNYTTNYKLPNGDPSNIYIIIENKFFEGQTDSFGKTIGELYQIHFETRQLKDRTNGSNINIFNTVINKSEGIKNYFGEVLKDLAKSYKKGIDGNYYIDALINFGFTEILFDFFDENSKVIKIDSTTSHKSRKVIKLPDISRFSNLTQLIIMDAEMVELDSSIGLLHRLEMLAFTNNKINKIPKEIGKLKNLFFLNLKGNPITSIPDDIEYLDKTKGGNLHRIAIDKDKIGEANYHKLKTLLPSVKFNE